jgi:hypothetical protein
MTDAELRSLVRQAVARHLGAGAVAAPDPLAPIGSGGASARPPAAGPAGVAHVSHAMYLTLVNTGDACVIEPSVACNHCGYCKSHGH